jgi:hypothetical protein
MRTSGVEREFVMPVKPLLSNPDINHLKHQAKDLMKAHALHRPDSAQRVTEFHPRFEKATDNEIFSAPFRLADAQLTIARERGFASWPRLKSRIEKPTTYDRLDLPHQKRIADATLRRAVDLLDAGDVAGLRAHIRRHPDVHLLPSSSAEERHWALALASQLGQVEIVRMLLDAGEDPNRYNPVGGHSHSTPLHQAAANGNGELVQLLVERGAHLDWKDTMWKPLLRNGQGTRGKKKLRRFCSPKTLTTSRDETIP